MGVFIHHNTLHAFQHLSFHEGVQQGAAALGARPYLALEDYRTALRVGRIHDGDVRAELDIQLGERSREVVAAGLTRAALWHTLLVTDNDGDDAAGLEYTVRLGTAPQCADLPLWRACVTRANAAALPEPDDDRVIRRHRDVLVLLGADDPDVVVHGELIRLAAAFLDHGQAHAALPGREGGFLAAVAALYDGGAAPPLLAAGVQADFRDVISTGRDAVDVIRLSLRALGVADSEAESFVLSTALALPGWTGMFSRLERHPDDHVADAPPALAEFLAVRLLFERRIVARTCAGLGVASTWDALRARLPPPPVRPRVLDAVPLWWIARASAWTAADVLAQDDQALAAIWRECSAFRPLQRRRCLHDAFERSYRRSILDALAARRSTPAAAWSERPLAQFVFCIDEREESMRRAIEELHPGYVTFGVAGFFGIAIDYQGLYDRTPAAHCPVVVTPAHQVHERPVPGHLDWHAARDRLRRTWHHWERRATFGSRTLSGGASMSFLLGPASSMRTLAHVLAPRSFISLGNRLTASLAPRPKTRLSTVRAAHVEDSDSGKPVGFSTTECADRVATVLRTIGLAGNFARVIVFIGHGSSSLNNPHESAHDCGACGGRRGGANARLFADMANRNEVRDAVRQRGITIPSDVWFVGALHDTADDSITYYDLEALPESHRQAFEDVHQVLERARRDNALERSRRFDDAPLGLSPDEALRHVEARSAHLAQPRPEYGHCTNTICIVGRRDATRGLHLDRRAFLVSYDPTTDVDDAILERILAAVGPVGAGISLEYYFSSVDNETFGCGTKLPHNVTALIGVMNGHQSDLRTGLPLQMVELHEPMRLLVVVEATEAALLGVAGRQPEIAELVGNAWVQLVSVDPQTGAMAVFERGRFVPYVPDPVALPVVDRSTDWHGRSRNHLGPALVRRGMGLHA